MTAHNPSVPYRSTSVNLNCDFYSFCGHKYIMAPQGTGGLYIQEGPY